MGVIQRQSIKNFFTSYIGIVIGFVNVLIIQPRFLTPEELGLTRVLYSFAILLSTVVPMGLANVAIKYFPQFRNAQTRHHGFFGFIVCGTLAGFLFTALLLFIFKSFFIGQYIEKSKLFADFFYWTFPLTGILAFVTLLNIYCYSLYKSTVPAFINDIVIRLGVIALISLYYLKLFSLQTFIALFVSVYGIQVLLLLIYIFYEEKPGWKIDWEFFRRFDWNPVIRYALVIWAASIASMGLKELATVFLGTQITLDNVAVFVVAAFIPTLIEVPLNALDKIATYNISTALSHNNMHIVEEIYKKSSRYMLLIGGILFLLINANVDSLLKFLPEIYRGGNEIILILSFGTLFNMATGLNSQILVYSGKYFYGAMMIIIAVLVNFFLQYTLIPEYGVIGVAIAMAVSGMLLNIVNTFIVWKYFHIHPLEQNTWKGIMLIAIVFVADGLLNHFENPIGDIFYHSAFITVMFAGAVFIFKLVPEVNELIKNKIHK